MVYDDWLSDFFTSSLFVEDDVRGRVCIEDVGRVPSVVALACLSGNPASLSAVSAL
jgi:hypothetical protein